MPASSILELIFAWSVETPQRDAVIFQSSSNRLERMTFRELHQRVEERSELFRELAPHSRIGLTAPHGPIFLIEALAILMAGHCMVPIGGHLASSERDDLAERAGIHAWRIFDQPELIPAAGTPLDSNSDQNFRALDPAYLRFTSGSTGQRKGVLLSHRSILERTAAANERLRISSSDRVLCLLPMVDHFVVSILLYLRYGATVLLVENDTAAPGFALAQNATVLYGSPPQYQSFSSPLPEVRLAVATTQGLSAPVAQRFLAATGQPLTQALGIIEAGLLTLNDERACTEPLLAGEPMPAYRVTISGSGRGGEIHISGPGLLDAYVSPWRPRASLLTEIGFPTGDHGWLDESGLLHLIGREKNRIELGSVSFFCEEIEVRINQHPLVEESCVFLKNDELRVEVVAFSDSDLNEWVRAQMPDLPIPLQVQFVESLPRTATGKLARPLGS